MRAMASACSGLAALDCTTVSSPRLLPRPFYHGAPACPPAGGSSVSASRTLPLFSEVYHHGQRGAAPVLETSRTALVLLDQQSPRQLVFFRIFGLASATAKTLPRYADRYLRVAP